jgi:hypothetical protein
MKPADPVGDESVDQQVSSHKWMIGGWTRTNCMGLEMVVQG